MFEHQRISSSCQALKIQLKFVMTCRFTYTPCVALLISDFNDFSGYSGDRIFSVGMLKVLKH